MSIFFYNCIKTNSQRALFFHHIPKTGGVSVTTALMTLGFQVYPDPKMTKFLRPLLRISPAHFDYELTSKIFNLNGIYGFAIVRHPIRRFVSSYKWAIKKSSLAETYKNLTIDEYAELCFENYKKNKFFNSSHVMPQSEFVEGGHMKIFKYEAGLDTILMKVLQQTDFVFPGQLDVPHLNKSSNQGVSVSKKLHGYLSDFYRRDFELYGYEDLNKGE